MRKIGITNPSSQIILTLNESYFNLAINAKGKADLYLHAYVWQEYLKVLDKSQDNASKPTKRLERRKEYVYERKPGKVQPVQKKGLPLTPKKPTM